MIKLLVIVFTPFLQQMFFNAIQLRFRKYLSILALSIFYTHLHHMAHLYLISLCFCIFYLPAYSSAENFPNIKDWKLNTIRDIYDSNELYAILGEKAEYYNNCGFYELRLAEYSKKDGKNVLVELYVFKDISGACGVYLSERNPDFEIQNIGTQGLYIRGEMIFFTGTYFVKLTDKGLPSSEKSGLLEIGVQIVNHFSPECKWPYPATLLPKNNKIKNTEEYIPASFLGYHFLNKVFSAKYDINNPVTLFILSQDTHEEAKALLDMYLGIFREDKVIQIGDFYQVADLFNGTILIGVKSGFLTGVICYSNIEGGRDLLTDVFEKIE